MGEKRERGETEKEAEEGKVEIIRVTNRKGAGETKQGGAGEKEGRKSRQKI